MDSQALAAKVFVVQWKKCRTPDHYSVSSSPAAAQRSCILGKDTLSQFVEVMKTGKEETWKAQPDLYRCVEAGFRTSGIIFSYSHGGQKAMKVHHSSRPQLDIISK